MFVYQKTFKLPLNPLNRFLTKKKPLEFVGVCFEIYKSYLYYKKRVLNAIIKAFWYSKQFSIYVLFKCTNLKKITLILDFVAFEIFL